jgi:rubrerythrin
MSNIFTGSEIVELGIQIEKNGRDFYATLAKHSGNEKTKEVFKFLASEEEKHIVVFEKILTSLDKYQPPESYPGEYLTYMTVLASEYIFTQKDKGAEIASKIGNDRQAVELGIGFEKDSILFYEGIKKVVADYEYKAIDQLIQQEQNHLQQLSALKRG